MSAAESPPKLPALDTLQPELYCPTCDQTFDPSHQRCPLDGTALVRLAQPKDPLIGRELDGRFTLRRRIGAGGMGAVYLAWQHSVGREVAVKVIHPKHNTDNEAAKRFLREAKLASRLAHPNTVTVIEFNQTEDGLLYLVMEFLQGRQLSEVLAVEGPFSIERMARVAIQLCDSLEAAHKLNIVHRDLKPGNIIILDGAPGRDFVKVLDFGLARSLGNDDSTKLTRTGEVVGTPHYLPPEAALGNPMDARGDIYSLGVIFYELLTGHLPFEAEGRRAMMIKHVYEEPMPLPLDIPDTVSTLIMSMLEKDPDRRPASVVELRARMAELIGSGQTKLPRKDPTGPTVAQKPTAPLPQVASVPPTVRKAHVSIPFDGPTSQQSVVPQPLADEPALPRWLWPLLGLVVGLGLGLFYLLRQQPSKPPQVISSPVPTTTASPIAPPAPQPVAPTVTPLPAAERKVALDLRSRPSANVTIDGKAVGRSPLVLDWPMGDRSLVVVFSEPGRKAVSKSLVPNAPATLDVTLPSAQKAAGKTGKTAPQEGFLLPE